MTDSRTEIVFSIPYALPSLNVRDRTHWAELARQKRALSQEVMAAMGGPRHFPRPPWLYVQVIVVRASAGRLDGDNLVASAKPLLDVLCTQSGRHPTGLGIIDDDNSRQCRLIVRQTGAMRGAGSTLVRIVRLDGPVT